MNFLNSLEKFIILWIQQASFRDSLLIAANILYKKLSISAYITSEQEWNFATHLNLNLTASALYLLETFQLEFSQMLND